MLQYSTKQRVGFAPIDIKISKIKVRDVFSNLNESPTVLGVITSGATTLPLTNGSMGITVPTGVHLTIAGDTTKYRVTGQSIDLVGADELQSMASSTATAGTFTLTFGKPPGNAGVVTTGAIIWEATSSEVQTAVDAAWAGKFVDGLEYVAGDISVAGGPVETTPVTFTYDGGTMAKKNFPLMTADGALLTAPDTDGTITQTTAGKPLGSTDSVELAPTLLITTSGGEAITFAGQELSVDLGEGSTFSWDEIREIELFRSRGILDSFRTGDEQPMTVSFAITYDFIKSISGTDITPTLVEALKNIGNASDWVTTATGDCPNYAVDPVVENDPNCPVASLLGEEVVLQQFIWNNGNFDVSSGLQTFDGICNTTEALITRKDLSGSTP